MKKLLSLSLALIMLFAFIPAAISASAETGTKVLYTMETGSRPGSASMTSRDGYVTYTEVNGESAMQITRNGSKGTWQDQAAGFSLPIDEMKALGTPKSVSFDVWTDAGQVFINEIFFATYVKTLTNTSTSTSKIFSNNFWFGTKKQTVTIDLSSGVGLKAMTSGFKFICLKNAYSSANTCTYAYINNVVYNYEYEPAQESPVGEATMADGAAMRVGNITGLRFYTKIDTDKIDAVKDDYQVQLGTLIAPADKIGENGLTFEDMAVGDYLDVKFNATKDDGSFNYYEEANFKGIVGTIANIKDKNANRKFVGRGYIKYTKDGVTETVYADYSEGNVVNNTRTISGIASSLKANSDYFDGLNSDQQSIIAYWSDKYIAE